MSEKPKNGYRVKLLDLMGNIVHEMPLSSDLHSAGIVKFENRYFVYRTPASLAWREPMTEEELRSVEFIETRMVEIQN